MRPTKYKKEYIETVENFTEEMSVDTLMSCCSVDHIALLLEVDRGTIYNWKKKHVRFFNTIKRWETKRNALFYELGQYSDDDIKKMSPAVWIFLSKNWLGLNDKQQIEVVDIPQTIKEFRDLLG